MPILEVIHVPGLGKLPGLGTCRMPSLMKDVCSGFVWSKEDAYPPEGCFKGRHLVCMQDLSGEGGWQGEYAWSLKDA